MSALASSYIPVLLNRYMWIGLLGPCLTIIMMCWLHMVHRSWGIVKEATGSSVKCADAATSSGSGGRVNWSLRQCCASVYRFVLEGLEQHFFFCWPLEFVMKHNREGFVAQRDFSGALDLMGVILSAYLTIMTFGVLYPPLGVLIGLSLTVIVGLYQVSVQLYFLDATKMHDRIVSALVVDRFDDDARRCLKIWYRSKGTLLLCAGAFYALILHDVAPDRMWYSLMALGVPLTWSFATQFWRNVDETSYQAASKRATSAVSDTLSGISLGVILNEITIAEKQCDTKFRGDKPPDNISSSDLG